MLTFSEKCKVQDFEESYRHAKDSINYLDANWWKSLIYVDFPEIPPDEEYEKWKEEVLTTPLPDV